MTHLYDAHFQAEDENGEPLSGALLYFYVTGTTTPITVYQDAGKAVQHTNPVVADSAGRFAPIWVDTNGYKTILKTSGGTTVQTTDAIYRGPGWSSSGYLTGPGVINTAAGSVTILAGGLSSTTGGLVQLYGPSHATQASDIVMRAGTSAVYQYDHDQNRQDWYAPANTLALRLTSTTLQPGSNDLLSLGSTSAGFADLYGATGFTWNIANGNWVATHSSAVMTISIGDLRVTTAGTNAASVVTKDGTQTLLNKSLTSPTFTGTVVFPSGSWTPVPRINGSATGVTTSAAQGSYLLIGDLYCCTTNIVLTSNGAGTGNFDMTGLPGTVSSGTGMIPKGYSSFSGLTGAPFFCPDSAATTVSLKQTGAATAAALTDTNVTDTAAFNGMFFFRV